MTDEEWTRFKNKLVETTTFPSVYMFKLIVPAENRLIALVENLFEEEADMHVRESEGGKYISITAKQVVMEADEVINVYKKAAGIKGVIFL